MQVAVLIVLCLAIAGFALAGLTPELSRAAQRPRRWDDHSASAEAAKRTRLERIVRPVIALKAFWGLWKSTRR